MRRRSRTILVALVAGSLCGAPLAAAALALPTGRTPASTGHLPTAAAGSGDAEPTTLRIDISGIEPLVPLRTSTLTVSGTVTNTGPTPVYGVTVSLDESGHAESRADLAASELAPRTAGHVLASQDFPRGIVPGRAWNFSVAVPMVGNELADDPRVYELAVVASGALAKDGAVAPLGVAGVPLPYFPDPITSKLRTALIIPMTAIPDQGPIPLPVPASKPGSDTLIAALQPDGRLGRLLSAVQAAPATGGSGGTQLTLAVDPALLDRVCTLAGRCGKHTVSGTPDSYREIADNWLSKLSTAVDSPFVTVVGLPYADADLAALTDAGDASTATSLLREAGSRVDQDLTLAAPTDLQPLLPVDGLADAGLTSAALEAGSTLAVVSSALFRPVVPSAGEPPTPTASTTLNTSAGTLPALVMDPTLERMLDPGANPSMSPRLQEQTMLAELAVITSEQPNDPVQRTVVLEAPRDWDVGADFSTRLIDALAAVPYVSSESLLTIAGARGVERERTATPPQPTDAPLPAAAVTTVDGERSVVRALHSVAADPMTETLSPPFDEGLDRSLSAWWRGANAGRGAALLTSVTNDLTSTVEKVRVGGGKHGVLLTGPSGKLPVQVSNLLHEPIAIVVHVKTDGLDQVTGRDVPLRLAPGSALNQVSVPITTRSTRAITVTMQLLAQSDASQQIAVATIQVRSSSVGKVAVGITASALTLLILLILVRAARQLAARRRRRPAA